ncbi:MAG: ribonuclease R [Mariprofundaceae bacterium]|nr:ribonuclease R [Mariprofundaceae bacterium]
MSRDKQIKSTFHKTKKQKTSPYQKEGEQAASPWDKASKRHASKNNHASKSKAGRRKAYGRDEATTKRPYPENKSHHQHDRKPSHSAEQLIGIVSAHPDGFGFVDVAGRDKGVFLPHEEMQHLMHGDEVEVRVVFKRGRESGEYIRTVKEATNLLIGQLSIQDGLALVKPRSRKMPASIVVKHAESAHAHDGDWVRIEIKRHSQPLEAKILEVLGADLTPQRLIDLVIDEQGLCESFPAKVLQESEKIADELQDSDCQGRKDLTHLPFVTIDGEDARDFDDAICVLPRGEGFEAWIAIADVAHYVHPHTRLDEEALERGNSFYFPDRVIPMLPEKLSNGLCSLNPRVKRLAMVVRIRFDTHGKRRSSNMYEAVIYSHARLTYTQVAKWLNDGDKQAVAGIKVRPMLEDAARLFCVLERCREMRGALDLDLPETRAVLEDGRVTDMASRPRNIAHKLIEELMLAANTSVAEFMEDRQCSLLYRIHPAPEREAIETLNTFLAPQGLHIKQHKKYDVRSGDVQRVLEQSEGKPYAHVLHRLILRSMQQAKYTTKNVGHFGLAYKSYGHFTSPIRRYADLTVHRRLKALIRHENPDKVQPTKELENIGLHVSTQERKQQRGEWDTQAMLAALYHANDVGKTMKATISGLTKRRLFFELEGSLAEAEMPVDDLNGLYEHDDVHHRLVSQDGGEAFNLGDQREVMLDSTDPVRGMIRVHIL